MCGLVGFVGSSLVQRDIAVFSQLLEVDAVRGRHSTGIFGVDAVGETSVFKRALASQDFLELTAAQNIMYDPTVNALVGHNRYATTGAVTNENAHPFKYGHITLVHNGSLTTQVGLPDHTKFAVDSENIAYAFFKDGAEATIPKLQGAFALIWHDEEDNTLNFVRNDERPLTMAETATGDLVFASERLMLSWIATRNHVNLKEVMSLPTGQIYSFSLDKFAVVPTITPVTLASTWESRGNYSYSRKYSPAALSSVLQKNSLKVGDYVDFMAVSWVPNSSGNHGVMKGVTADTSALDVEVFGALEDEVEAGAFYEGVVTGGAVVAGKDIIRLRSATAIDSSPAEEDDDKEKDVVVLGKPMPRAEYNQIIATGCAYCCGVFDELDIDNNDIYWEDKDTPMHRECASMYNSGDIAGEIVQ